MEQPSGFVAPGESGLVCKLHHSLYGLKHSHRAWIGQFSLVVQEFGMIRSTTDQNGFLSSYFYWLVYLLNCLCG